MAKQLRWTLQVNAGESVESIQEGNEDEEATLQKEPLYQSVMKMKLQIVKVKEILKKSKELKDELKYDIHSVNVEIDKIVEKIGKEYIIESLFRHQTNNAKYLEAQLDQLRL